MSEAEIKWTDGALESAASIGPWFVTTSSGSWSVHLDGVGVVRRGLRGSRAESKAAIVDALRELRVLGIERPAVVAGDDPVLRWETAGIALRCARIRYWLLSAHSRGWSICINSQEVASECVDTEDLEANQRAAESTLASLGVRFRVEHDEQNGGAK